MNLNKKIRAVSTQLGVNYFGIGDLSLARDYILRQGGDIVSNFRYCISIGIILPHAIVDQLPFRSNKAVAVNYRFHAYEVINQRLDYIASFASNIIQQLGYAVMPVPAAERYDDERICAVFSHKLGASLAGLGWIGKSCLMITPENGPRVRWSSILTDAPLKPTGRPMDEECGECNTCVTACPVHAFTGRNFVPDEARELRYDARKCSDYFNSMKNRGEVPVCGMCLYSCPYGRKPSHPPAS